ncbi:pyridoxamine 5'-phosphate oxidase family protein [Antarctobacter sp.]|uniref:FAD-binding oxidoreductase n=1 Tax=Antarctobacter sp. TaxID=1872577 RepID=UPI002B279EDF|nr:pyridoxamine 5'-phosphate oxidase family protein [Antarctobacter sp.]
MTTTDLINPFHAGERAAQDRAGIGNVAEWAGGFIRDHLPEQHRAFHTSLPFMVVSGGDTEGRTWITVVEGPDGYAISPDPRRVQLNTQLGADDPLAAAFNTGTDIGVLGIELATRRRNRFSGHVKAAGAGYAIDIRQTFGNCPQYIHERAWTRVETTPGTAKHSDALTEDQVARIGVADTMFIGSGHQGEKGAASNGYDASHRGGAPGFVHVADATHLQIPDYAGNNFFNTIGNLISDPHIGLLFIDFETGGLLHISGRATVDWDPKGSHDHDAWRMINVEIDAVIDRPAAVSLRWAKQDHLSRRLKLAKRVKESADITSFYFTPADGRPLDPFEAGQYLPIEVQIPGQKGTSKRSYSLSGPPQERRFYRISVKREDKGLVSRFLHDQLREGSVIEAQKPSGDFVIPCSNCPLVLVSAGVGLTPMLSALHASSYRDRPVWYVYGTRGSSDHAMRREVAALVSANHYAAQHIAYSRPEKDDIEGRHYHSHGRITADMLIGLNAGSQAQYMLCGPAAFLADIRNGLEARGVAPEQIHFETFGPTG